MEYYKTSGIIPDACITVHKIMGPGFLLSEPIKNLDS